MKACDLPVPGLPNIPINFPGVSGLTSFLLCASSSNKLTSACLADAFDATINSTSPAVLFDEYSVYKNSTNFLLLSVFVSCSSFHFFDLCLVYN